MTRKIFSIVLIALLAIGLWAIENKGMASLQVTASVAEAALGDAGVAAGTDIFSLRKNPALAVNLDRSVAFSQGFWFEEVNISHIGVNSFAGNWALGFSMNVVDYGKIDRYDNYGGQPIGEYQPVDLVYQATVARKVIPSLALGVNLKAIYEKIDVDNSAGWAADFGVFYQSPINGLDFGASVRNMGNMNKMREEELELPVAFSGGAAFSRDLTDQLGMTLLAEMGQYQSYDMLMKTGLQLDWQGMLLPRFGYQIGHDTYSYSAGLGVQWKQFGVDYAFQPIEDFDATHRIGLQYRF